MNGILVRASIAILLVALFSAVFFRPTVPYGGSDTGGMVAASAGGPIGLGVFSVDINTFVVAKHS